MRLGPDEFIIVCVDLIGLGRTITVGEGPDIMYIGRDNANVVVPLLLAACSNGFAGSTQVIAGLRVKDVIGQFDERGSVDAFPFCTGNEAFYSSSLIDDSDGDGDPICLVVRYRDFGARALTEQDFVAERSERLVRQYRRDRPTLPPVDPSAQGPCDHKGLPLLWHLFSCPFKGCTVQTGHMQIVYTHINDHHGPDIDAVCGTDVSWMGRITFVFNAVVSKERARWPDAGLAVACRALRNAVTRYNDRTTNCLVCFICGHQHVIIPSYGPQELNAIARYIGKGFLENAERECLAILLNHCRYDLWKVRYVDPLVGVAHGVPDANAHLRHQVASDQAQCGGPWFDQWVLEVDVEGGNAVVVCHVRGSYRFFGCLDDARCTPRWFDGPGFPPIGSSGKGQRRVCSAMCDRSEIFLCYHCRVGLFKFRKRVPIPMASANVNFLNMFCSLLPVGMSHGWGVRLPACVGRSCGFVIWKNRMAICCWRTWAGNTGPGTSQGQFVQFRDALGRFSQVLSPDHWWHRKATRFCSWWTHCHVAVE